MVLRLKTPSREQQFRGVDRFILEEKLPSNICTVDALIVYNCVTNDLKLSSLNNHHFTVSGFGGQEFQQSSFGSFFCSVHHRLRSLGGIQLVNGLDWKI